MKYIIKESQINELIQRKQDKNLANKIIGKIDKVNKNLNESIIINEAVNDILKIYNKKGLINNNIKDQLINSGKVTESQFKNIKL